MHFVITVSDKFYIIYNIIFKRLKANDNRRDFFSDETGSSIDLPLQRTTRSIKVPIEHQSGTNSTYKTFKRSVIIFLPPLRINSDCNLTQLGAERNHFAYGC